MINKICAKFESFMSKCPDLGAMFPTEESRYSAYIKFLYATIAILTISAVLGVFANSVMISALMQIGIVLLNIYVSLYIFWKSKVISFVIKLLAGLFISLLIMSILLVAVGPIVGLIAVVLSFIANRRRLNLLKKYKRFIFYSIIPSIVSGIMVALSEAFTFKLNHAMTVEQAWTYLILDLICTIISVISPCLMMHYVLRREQKKYNTPFLTTVRLFTVVPVTLFFFIFSYVGLFHISGMSDTDVFGDVNSDPLAGDLNVAHAQNNFTAQNSIIADNANSTPTQPIDNIANNTDTVNNIQTTEAYNVNHTASHADFNTPKETVKSSYQINDSNMMPQASVDINNNNTADIKDMNNQHIGSIEQDGNITTLKDSQNNVVATKDNTTGFVYDGEGKVQGISTTNTNPNTPNSYYDTTTGKMVVEQNGVIHENGDLKGSITKK